MSTDELAARDAAAERGLLGDYLDRIRSGELGFLPVLFGLVVIWAVFYSQEPRFLSAFNLTNLSLQVVAVGIVSIGVVWVLLLGEIDLAVGSISGFAAAVAVVGNLDGGIPGWVCILIGLAVGAAVGLIHGLVITVVRVPSFIVTLAGLIGWQGLLLYTLGEGGTRNITDDQILGLTDTFFSDVVAWPLAIALIALYVLTQQLGRIRRVRSGLRTESLTSMIVRHAIVTAAGLVAVGVFARDRGLPLAILILLALVVIFDLVARRTLFGRHVYAVGGNAEAARRAGINVQRIRLTVFVMSGAFAAAGGIMAASRLLAVNQASGGGTFLLLAIAGAVIGGTSLFGGRGTVYSALLGALVLGSLANGIALLGLSSDFEYMLTAAVLLAAVIVDALARRGRQAAIR